MTGTASTSVPPTLSIIVPTYRGGLRIYDNLVCLDQALSSINEPYEIIVVSDGDVDNTYDEVQRLRAPHVQVYHYVRNMGKGFALRYGVARSRGKIVTFIDGDGDIDPEQIAVYVQIMRETKADIVVGSKRHAESDVVYPLLRRMYSMTYQTLLRLFFHLDVRDTQVGLKLFKREVLAAVLPRIVVKRYAFDLELLVVAKHLGFSRVVEAPVRIGQRFSSTINRRAIMSILFETAAIYYRMNVLHFYEYNHVFTSLDNLLPLTEAELEAAEQQNMGRTVVLGLLDSAATIMSRCYNGVRARLGGAVAAETSPVVAEIEEDRHRASI